jgi:hypothetical protein
LTYFFFLVAFFAFLAAFFFVAIVSPPSRQPIDSLRARCYFFRPRDRAYRLQSAAAERLMGHTLFKNRRVGCNPLGDFILEATLGSVQEVILRALSDFIVAMRGAQVKPNGR